MVLYLRILVSACLGWYICCPCYNCIVEGFNDCLMSTEALALTIVFIGDSWTIAIITWRQCPRGVYGRRWWYVLIRSVVVIRPGHRSHKGGMLWQASKIVKVCSSSLVHGISGTRQEVIFGCSSELSINIDLWEALLAATTWRYVLVENGTLTVLQIRSSYCSFTSVACVLYASCLLNVNSMFRALAATPRLAG